MVHQMRIRNAFQLFPPFSCFISFALEQTRTTSKCDAQIAGWLRGYLTLTSRVNTFKETLVSSPTHFKFSSLHALVAAPHLSNLLL